MLSFASFLQGAIKMKLFFACLVLTITCHSQPGSIERPDLISDKPAYDDINALLKHRIQQVDSMSHTGKPGNHFARIYTASMSQINQQLTNMDSGAQNFVKKFEISFIGYFLEAAAQFEKNGNLPAESIWHFYFINDKAQPWQLTLIGINAHVNGDIWKALVKNFSAGEIRRYKKNLLSFQASLSKTFQPLFDQLLDESSYLRFMNAFTKGSAKLYGEWLIYNWRLRAINLAILYFEDPEKFKKKMKAVDRKRHKIDRAILSRG
jgi:hypothetical protein